MAMAEGPPMKATTGPRREQACSAGATAEGTPKGLARPRSDSTPEEHAGHFEGGRPGPVRVAEPRGATTCSRGEAAPG
jgi:hypothetical protein